MRSGYDLQEESVKLLGLHIDENLDWKVHINQVRKKISKGSYLLWRHRSKLNIQTKKTIYESFIRCHLIYCLAVWGGAKPVYINPLWKAVNKSLKQMGPYKQHTMNRLKNLSILKLLPISRRMKSEEFSTNLKNFLLSTIKKFVALWHEN